MAYKCVRCSNKVSTKGGRCASCLKKLRANKLKPSRHEHVSKLISDAHRREQGSGKSSKKSKGLGDTKAMKRKIKEGYKKYGTSTTLSPDRKDNTQGYASSNVRMVPKKLNRGRHTVDSKKLSEWKKKIKKSNLDADTLQKSVIQSAYDRGLTDLAIALEIKHDFIKKLLKI